MGRVWTVEELEGIATICVRHEVFVIADEIHADLTLPPATFVPFAEAANGTGVSWAALHGPSKTFGLAGVCDTLVVTDDDRVAKLFETRSSQLHLTRNTVFGRAAFEAAYRSGASWLDDMLDLVHANQALLGAELPDGIEVAHLEGTYLAWLDFRSLGMDARELASWLAESARLGLSPGHWFGREGAGFARMTIAVPPEQIEDAIARLQNTVAALKR